MIDRTRNLALVVSMCLATLAGLAAPARGQCQANELTKLTASDGGGQKEGRVRRTG